MERVIILNDIFVTMVDLPATVKSYVVANADQSYTIVLNSKLSYEQNMISYKHELEHIRNGDYEKKCSADFIEINAHR
jgi:hypothetical protein